MPSASSSELSAKATLSLRRERDRIEALVDHWHRSQAGPGKYAALKRAGDMFQRLAVTFEVFDAPLRSEVGH